MLDLDVIDLPELGRLLSSQDWQAGFLSPETGEVWPAFDGVFPGIDSGDVDEEEIDDLIVIEGEGSHNAYADMTDFAESVPDRHLRDRLLVALDGRGAFRRFRDVVYNTPEEIGKVWNSFSDARASARAVGWLAREGLVDVEAATARRQLLERSAAEILDGLEAARHDHGRTSHATRLGNPQDGFLD